MPLLGFVRLVAGLYTWAVATALVILPTTFDGDMLKSLLVAVGGVGAAYGGWRLRALAVEKANADALERRVAVLEMELTLEKDARVDSEKQILVLEGEIKALESRPNMETINEAISGAIEMSRREHSETIEALAAIAAIVGGRRANDEEHDEEGTP